MYKGRSILNTASSGGFAGDSLALGTAGTIGAENANVRYALEDSVNGFHSFQGNVSVAEGYYYIGDGSLLSGIVSMPSDIVANSVTSNSNVLVASGTVSAPSVSFADGKTSGMYLSNALSGNLSFVSNGRQTLTLSSSVVEANAALKVLSGGVSVAELGTAASPAYSWTGTGNASGIYLENAIHGNVGIAANGTQRLLVSNLAATTYITGNLQVNGNISATGNISFGNASVASLETTGELETGSLVVVGSADILGNATAASLELTPGNAAVPSLSFAGSTSTGLYAPVAGQVAVSIGGVEHMTIAAGNLSANANVHVRKAGTAAAPSLYINNDTSSGFYQPGTGQVAVSIGGVEHMTIVAGNLSANANVHVRKAGTAAAPSLYLNNDTSSGLYQSAVGQVAVSTGGVETLKISNGLLSLTGNISMPQIGAPNAPGRILHFGKPFQNQLICLYGDISPGTTSFYGFGIGASTLRYQVYGGAAHGFYDDSTFLGQLSSTGWRVGTLGSAASPAYSWTGTGAASGIYLANAVNGNVGITANGTQRLLVSNAAGTTFITGNLVVDGTMTAATTELVLEDLVLDGAAGNAILTTTAEGILNADSGVRAFAGNIISANVVSSLGNLGITAAGIETLTLSPGGLVTANANLHVQKAGTAAAPSLYLGTDASSGLYQPVVGQVALSSNGLQTLTVAPGLVWANGNVTALGNTPGAASFNLLDSTFRWSVVNGLDMTLHCGTNRRISFTLGSVPNTTLQIGDGSTSGGIKHVYLDNRLFMRSVAGAAGSTGTATNPSISFDTDTDTGLFRPADNSVAITTGATQRFTVSNVGITANVNGNLSVGLGSVEVPSLIFGSDTASGLYQNAVGQVSIATGGVESTRFTNSNVNVYGNLAVTQDITAFASDIRLKSNIRPITGHPMQAVQLLRGVRFEWRDDGPQPMRGTDVGLIAQDVANVIPEAVCPAPCDNSFLTIRMSHQLTALLVEAVKELGDRVGALEKII